MDFRIGDYNTIFVVSYEAGAAQVLSSFLKNKVVNRRGYYKDIKYCIDGPAKDIFRKKLGKIIIHPIEGISNLISGKDIVLTGRSFVPELEREAIRLSKLNKIRVVTFLDHWVNYEEGFIPACKRPGVAGHNFSNYLPDEIVVGDLYATKLIKKTRIPWRIVRFAENEYFKDLRRFFKSKKTIPQKKLLYLTEPIYDDLKEICGDGNIWGFNEFDVMRDIINATMVFKQMGFKELIIRIHPNENKEKYLKIIRNAHQNNIKIVFSKNKLLGDDIADVKMVIGLESMGLVIALLAGKKAVSYVPSGALKKCLLPQEDLIRINDFRRLKDIRL